MLKKRDLLLDFLLIFTSILGLFSLLAVNKYYFKLQLYFLIISLIVYLFMSSLSAIWVRTIINNLYIIIFILLIYLLLFGESIRGSASWITLGFVNFQPGEFFKAITAYLVANIFTQQTKKRTKVIKTIFLLGIPLILVLLQPDFGTFIILFGIIFSIYFFSQMSIKSFIVSIVLFISISLIGFSFLQPYQKNRITSFLNPANSSLEAGYNVNQAKIAIGSGGIFGKGFKNNTQVQLNFLPEAHTDFIFAAASESFGLFFSIVLIISLGLIIKKLAKYSFNSKLNLSTRYYSFGLLFIIFTQTFLNIGMNMGLVPVTGLTLPFISYGGTSLITLFFALGILQKKIINKD